MFKTAFSVSYYRNFIFGVEDSLVSTVGLLSGVAIANVNKETILLTGVVLIFVEAFSMAAGSFLSEKSAQEYAQAATAQDGKSIVSGLVMFFSYFVSGFVPLSAYLIWPVETALPYSITGSIAALAVLGMASGRLSRSSMFKSALRMSLVGGIAIAVGITAGLLVA